MTTEEIRKIISLYGKDTASAVIWQRIRQRQMTCIRMYF